MVEIVSTDSDSDEYYIMTRDAYKGIVINNLSNGSNLVLQVYDTSNQINLHKMVWKKYTVNNNYIRLAPVNNSSYAMDIETIINRGNANTNIDLFRK